MLKRDVDPTRLVQRLRELAIAGRNLQSGGQDTARRQNDFVRWVHDVEQLYGDSFSEPRLELLHTDRYWRIERGDFVPRIQELLSDELKVQVTRLDDLASRVETMRVRFDGDRTMVVPDTNVFLHFKPFDELRWNEI